MPLKFILAAALLLAAVLPCQATAIFVAPSLSGSPGQTLLYQGSLENGWGYDAFLTGAGITLAAFDEPDLDLSPFLLNAPLSMAAGELAGPFDWFTVTIPAGMAPGSYLGDLTIQGGPSEDSDGVLDSLAFEVVVREAAPPGEIPEPATLLTAAAAICLLALRRRALPSN